MALAININDLLNKLKIESNRIEFKKGWNPGSISQYMCFRQFFVIILSRCVYKQSWQRTVHYVPSLKQQTNV